MISDHWVLFELHYIVALFVVRMGSDTSLALCVLVLFIALHITRAHTHIHLVIDEALSLEEVLSSLLLVLNILGLLPLSEAFLELLDESQNLHVTCVRPHTDNQSKNQIEPLSRQKVHQFSGPKASPSHK